MIVINGGVFSPAIITVAEGTVIEFENLDHSDVMLISDYPFSQLLGSELTFDLEMDKVGTFYYWDESSPLNKGEIIVTGTSTTTTTTTTPPATSTTLVTTTTSPSVSSVTVTLTAEGFQPNSVTIEKGGSITFVNNTSSAVDLSSEQDEAITATVSVGQSATFIFTTPGTLQIDASTGAACTIKVT